eukprot:scaffold59106_cov23-Tisochrysis_lutea.AAC.1
MQAKAYSSWACNSLSKANREHRHKVIKEEVSSHEGGARTWGASDKCASRFVPGCAYTVQC